MFFRFDIGARARAASRLIGDIRGDIVRALVEEKFARGLTQQELANKLGITRSELNRSLVGKSELTLRSIAELAWALDKEVSFELREPQAALGQNHPTETSTAASFTARRVGDHAHADPSSSRVVRTFFSGQIRSEKEE